MRGKTNRSGCLAVAEEALGKQVDSELENEGLRSAHRSVSCSSASSRPVHAYAVVPSGCGTARHQGTKSESRRARDRTSVAGMDRTGASGTICSGCGRWILRLTKIFPPQPEGSAPHSGRRSCRRSRRPRHAGLPARIRAVELDVGAGTGRRGDGPAMVISSILFTKAPDGADTDALARAISATLVVSGRHDRRDFRAGVG